MKNVVVNFINGKVKNDIAAAKSYGVSVEVPIEAYNNLPEFYQLCAEALTPLGYRCEESHDGGGMYNTLYVTWKEPFKKSRGTLKKA